MSRRAVKVCEHAAVVEWDWGVDDPPSSFRRSLVDGGAVHSNDPDDVPAVIAARAHHYIAAPEAPLWCFLPAVWPAEARRWVRDSRVRHLTRQYDGGPPERLPWTAADHADYENDTNALLGELGLPGRPGGRIWLLRAPETWATPHGLLDDVWARWQASGGAAMATPDFVRYVQDEVHALF